MSERVVITGMGAVTPLGLGVEALWSGVLAGRSAVGPITRFDTSALATRIAAEVKDFDPGAHFDRKEARRMERFVQFALLAPARRWPMRVWRWALPRARGPGSSSAPASAAWASSSSRPRCWRPRGHAG